MKPSYRVSKPKIILIHSLLQTNPAPTKQNVEDNFDGNICRCTGEPLQHFTGAYAGGFQGFLETPLGAVDQLVFIVNGWCGIVK